MNPLWTNIHWPYRNGWQLVCCTGVPVEARTWARNSGELICALTSRRLRSPHAGDALRNRPGTSAVPYQPRP